MAATIRYHEGDISTADAARYSGAIAIDTETLGLVPRRDRLCVVQLSPGDGSADVIRIASSQKQAPNLVAMMASFARRSSTASTSPITVQRLRCDNRFDFLHQDRLPPLPDLYRPPRPEGQSQRNAIVTSPSAAVVDWAPRPSRRPSSNMPRPTCSIFMRCATS